ncbi:MAG: nuclease [Rhodobacteraceae bacterium]|nr:nuclease [Paracoccaceae bacterium]
MAKRRRLSGPNPDFLPSGGLETKSMFPPAADSAYRRTTPPIADVAGEASAVAALDEVTDAMAAARDSGRMVLEVPLDAIQIDYLVRDRMVVGDDDMEALVASIRARGQQTPIEVTDLGDGRYGLISGWRRCHALRKLFEETGEAGFGQVLALLRRPEESSEAYLAMVEENEIRVGLSYYERARIAAKAVDQGVFETEKQALLTLFASASRAKRSKIRSFLSLVRAFDGLLVFPAALGERLGLKLAKAIDEDPTLSGRIRQALVQDNPSDAAGEQAVLTAALSGLKQTLNPSLESDTAKFPHAKAHLQVGSGLALETTREGRLILSGAAVDETFRTDLLAWLSERSA